MMLSVMLPCYEEGKNLQILIPAIKEALKNISGQTEILIVDTIMKKDNTEEICKAFDDEIVQVRYIPRRCGNSYGDAIRTGIDDAKGEYIIVMDADGSHNPKDIVRLYGAIKKGEYDVVIGSRYTRGGNTDNPFVLVAMSWILNVCYRILFQLDVKDISDSYRIYKAEMIKNINLVCDNFDIVEEILIKLTRKYSRVMMKEIPITFEKRKYGESKRDLLKFIISYFETIHRLMKLKNED